MLKSELYDIGDVVKETLLDGLQRKRDLPPDLSMVKKMCARIESNWTSRIFSTAKDHVIGRYVRFHQAGITELSDEVSNSAQGAEADQSGFLQGLLAELERLLFFLRSRCYHHFDIDHKVSGYFAKQQGIVIRSLFEDIASLRTDSVDEGLLKVLRTEIREWLDEGLQISMSYRGISCLSDILSLVHEELSKPEGTSTLQVVAILFRRNLNTHRFVNWLKKRYEFPFSESENQLSAEAENLMELYANPDERFDRRLPSVDEQVLPWLRELLLIRVPEPLPDASDISKDQLTLVLSVPQFAMFIRVFQQNGCFSEQNATAIMRFFIRHFNTRKKGNISANSFNHAFYSKDQLTAAIVLDHLQRMTRYVNKIYFFK